MDLSLHARWPCESRKEAASPYKNKLSNKCDNTTIIYLIVCFKPLLGDLRPYFRQEKPILLSIALNFFFHTYKA